MESKGKQYLFLIIKIVASIFITYVLATASSMAYDEVYYWGYYDQGRLDYFAGDWNTFWFTVTICTGIFLISVLFIWKLFKIKLRLIAAGLIAVLMVCSFAYNTYQENLLEIYEPGGWMEEVNLTSYEPFREDTHAKSLDVESSLSLQNDLPRLDGATALYPLYAAFARATYPEADYFAYDESSIIVCSRTSEAFNNLLDGTSDVVFLMGVSEDQRKQANELGLELRLTPIGKEAFIFFVNKRNFMSDLTVENIIGIYSGRIKNWREVGGRNRKILAYQRPETSGSQVMLKEIMGDVPIVEIPEKDIYDEMMGMYMGVAYKNHGNSLGYSFLYYIRDMIAENKIKFLSIDGVPPTAENIASGEYPYAHDFYAVTIVREPATEQEAERMNNTEKLINWILSAQGQSLVEKTGYVPLPQ